MCAISLCHSQPSGRPASCRQPLYTRNRQPIDEGSEVNSITRQTADRPPGTISTLPPLADSPKCYMTCMGLSPVKGLFALAGQLICDCCLGFADSSLFGGVSR